MDERMIVAVAQFAPTEDRSENLRAISEAAASARGADVVVLPEYANASAFPFDDSLRDRSEPLDGAFVAGLQQIAHTHRILLVAGMLERTSAAGRPANTCVAVDHTGLVASYRKVHLYDAFGQRESDWIDAGDPADVSVFAHRGFTFGLMTCYDLRFPEMARMLAGRGADAILVPAEWVRGALKEHHWQTLITARAIENTTYVVAAGQTGPIGIGRSAIVDPEGVHLAGLGTAAGVATAVLDRAEIDRIRTANPALALRRYEVHPRE